MKTIKVLLVDDNERFLESIKRFVLSAPDMHICHLDTAVSGEDAVTLAAKLRPDLVLMDFAMPGMDGLVATRHIKCATVPPRVVILTIHDNSEYRRAAFDAGADGFVSKSEFVKTLALLVQSLFPETSDGPPANHHAPEVSVAASRADDVREHND